MPHATQRLAPVLALGALAALAGCRQDTAAPRPRPLVVASFYPLYEFTRQVASDLAEVVSLVPAGVEPHDWEPSPRDVVRIRGARVFVYNGAGFEPWAERLPAQDAGASGPRVVRATAGLELLPAGTKGRGGAASDPHVWLDPVLATRQVEVIRDALEAADAAHAAAYADNARAFLAKLTALHADYVAGLATCTRRDLIVSHDAFEYLARRYRLSIVPVMGLAPDAEPSPAQLASLVRLASRRKAKYVFVETLVSPRLAETLAREAGARTMVLNPLEGRTQDEVAAGKDYLDLMRANLKTLRIALECR